MTPLERINSIQKIAIQDEDSLNFFIINLRKADYIAIDTETNTLAYSDIVIAGSSFYMGGDVSFYFPVNHTTGEKQLPLDLCIQVLKDELLGKKLILHNFIFDALVLRKYGVDLTANKYFDTMVAAHLIDNKQFKGLKALAKKYFKYDQTHFDTIAKSVDYDSRKISLDVMTPYACDDAIVTYMLFEIFKPKIKELDLENLFYNIEMPWLPVLIETKEVGVLFDKSRMEQYLIDLNKEIKGIEDKIFSYNSSNQATLLGGTVQSFNLASTPELALFLFKKLGLTIHKRNDTGAASTNDESLQAIKDEHPVVNLILQHRKMLTYKKMFIMPLPKKVEKDGRIRPDFINTRTDTGRLASKNPNFQQLPNSDKLSGWEKEFALRYDIRACLIVPEDETMIAIDYSSQEMRVAAFMGQDKVLTDVFNKNLDPHLATGNGCFNLGLSDTQMTKGTPEHKESKDKYYSFRDKGKTANFSVMYGSTKWNLSKQLNSSEEEADKIIKGFWKTYKGINAAQGRARKEAVENGFTRNYFGRIERFDPPTERKHIGAIERAAGNFIIQGTCADITRVVARKVYEKFKGTDLKFQLFVHDEIVFSCKNENVEKYIPILKDIMENSVVMNPPLIVDTGTGKNYSEAK